MGLTKSIAQSLVFAHDGIKRMSPVVDDSVHVHAVSKYSMMISAADKGAAAEWIVLLYIGKLTHSRMTYAPSSSRQGDFAYVQTLHSHY